MQTDLDASRGEVSCQSAELLRRAELSESTLAQLSNVEGQLEAALREKEDVERLLAVKVESLQRVEAALERQSRQLAETSHFIKSVVLLERDLHPALNRAGESELQLEEVSALRDREAEVSRELEEALRQSRSVVSSQRVLLATRATSAAADSGLLREGLAEAVELMDELMRLAHESLDESRQLHLTRSAARREQRDDVECSRGSESPTPPGDSSASGAGATRRAGEDREAGDNKPQLLTQAGSLAVGAVMGLFGSKISRKTGRDEHERPREVATLAEAAKVAGSDHRVDLAPAKSGASDAGTLGPQCGAGGVVDGGIIEEQGQVR